MVGEGHDGLALDLSDISAHDRLVEQARQGGELAALVHCAAVLVRRDTVDEVTEEDLRDELLKNAPSVKSGLFLVPKVIDGEN